MIPLPYFYRVVDHILNYIQTIPTEDYKNAEQLRKHIFKYLMALKETDIE